MAVHSHAESSYRAGSGLLLLYEKSLTIYHQGDEATTWYEIVSGAVRTCRFSQSGQRQVTGFYYSGDVFGIDEGAFTESAEAVTDVVVRCHRRILSSQPLTCDEQKEGDAYLLRRALESARQNVALLGRKTALQRVAAFFLALPPIGANAFERHLPMSRTDIGDHLGLTLHTVSRMISELARRELIAFPQLSRRRITILDPDGLHELAGSDVPEPHSAVHPAGSSGHASYHFA